MRLKAIQDLMEAGGVGQDPKPQQQVSLKRRAWRRICRWALRGAVLATTFSASACAQTQSLSAPSSAMTPEGRPIATELPPGLLRLLDAAKSLNEEAGLILDRESIYATLGVRPIKTKNTRTTEGGLGMGETLASLQSGESRLEGSLGYAKNPESTSWSVEVKVSYRNGTTCYPSRLVEASWGKPFVYKPLGVHAFMDELLRRQSGAPPTGPHDGQPFNASFRALRTDSASVTFTIARGGCLSTIAIGNLFDTREYNDDHIYHE